MLAQQHKYEKEESEKRESEGEKIRRKKLPERANIIENTE